MRCLSFYRTSKSALHMQQQNLLFASLWGASRQNVSDMGCRGLVCSLTAVNCLDRGMLSAVFPVGNSVKVINDRQSPSKRTINVRNGRQKCLSWGLSCSKVSPLKQSVLCTNLKVMSIAVWSIFERPSSNSDGNSIPSPPWLPSHSNSVESNAWLLPTVCRIRTLSQTNPIGILWTIGFCGLL